MEKRQEVALSKYEGTHARLPQVIRSFSEDIRTLQTQLRCSKASYRQLEDRHRNQSAELAAVQKKYKHLLDLTKNKQLSDREKLSHQLEVAENTVKEQEKKIQVSFANCILGTEYSDIELKILQVHRARIVFRIKRVLKT